MPRKVNYGVNYEEDFDDYEDYGYDCDDGCGYAEEDGEYLSLSRELERFPMLKTSGLHNSVPSPLKPLTNKNSRRH